jgi:hypothetical protein
MSEQSQPRPIAVDTSLLFHMLRSAVHHAECKIIDGKRCFIIQEGAYLNIASYFFASGRDFEFDPRIATEGYDNISIMLSARDTGRYWLACKSDPLLDRLWEAKGPKSPL